MNYESKLQLLDNYLLGMRGFVSKYPENKKAILLFSGGLDSVVLAAKLIAEKGITIFPLQIIRNQSNLKGEERSVKFFERYYKKKFKDKFQSVQRIKIDFPPENIKKSMTAYVEKHGYPCRDNFFSLYGTHYAVSLRKKWGEVFSIFTSAIPGGTYTHDTLLALRSTTILACNSTPFSDWNITSPNLDLNLENKLTLKKDLVLWGSLNKIPMEYTHTCIVDGSVHCGKCIFCVKRKNAFLGADVIDNTLYSK